jgi:tetratricopeptide (TPR) repeat protein
MRHLGPDTPHSDLWHHNLGLVYRAKGNLPAAEVELRDALARKARNVTPLAGRGGTEQYLGLVLLEQGKVGEAIEMLQRARAERNRPEVSGAHKAETLFALARAYLEDGRDRAEVRALASKAIEQLDTAEDAKFLAEIEAWVAKL